MKDEMKDKKKGGKERKKEGKVGEIWSWFACYHQENEYRGEGAGGVGE